MRETSRATHSKIARIRQKRENISMSFEIHVSERGLPLVYVEQLPTDDTKIITVENYLKWYTLSVVSRNGVETLQHNNEIHFNGHVPVPADVEAYAEKYGMEVDRQAMEMIVGRWNIENLNSDTEFIGAKYGFSDRAKAHTAAGRSV